MHRCRTAAGCRPTSVPSLAGLLHLFEGVVTSIPRYRTVSLHAGGRGHLPQTRANGASHETPEPKTATGLFDDRTLPHGRTGPTFAALFGLCKHRGVRQLVPESALHEVPVQRRSATGPVVPSRRHNFRTHQCDCLIQQSDHLRPAGRPQTQPTRAPTTTDAAV
jgi:hypothetical protein